MTTQIPNFDPAWAADLAEFCAEAYGELMAELAQRPQSGTQVDYVLLADYALDCGCVTYALGAEPHDVHIWMARAAHAFAQVFRLRGTVTVLTTSGVAQEDAAEQTALAEPDLSLTNSRRGLLAMYVAVIAGDRDLAEQIAAAVGDPPNASYLGPDSVVCTPDEQQVAYAMKALLLGQVAVGVFYATGLGAAAPLIRWQAAAINGLLAQDPDEFLGALEGLLAAHAAAAAMEQHRRDPRRLMNLPALALAALALTSGLVDRRRLPGDEVYLPLPLIERAGEPDQEVQ